VLQTHLLEENVVLWVVYNYLMAAHTVDPVVIPLSAAFYFLSPACQGRILIWEYPYFPAWAVRFAAYANGVDLGRGL